MASLIDTHVQNTGIRPETVVADSRYGAVENLLIRDGINIKAHMPTAHY